MSFDPQASQAVSAASKWAASRNETAGVVYLVVVLLDQASIPVNEVLAHAGVAAPVLSEAALSPIDLPAPQAAARALWEERCRWFTPARQPYLPPGRRDVLAWEHVRDTTEAAAAEHQGRVGAINGCALVLVVIVMTLEVLQSFPSPPSTR